jgi:glycosyltransferase involved in cell wall biosynthesis
MPQPSLTVVIPTRNRPESLAQLLGQLGRQSLPATEFEVIVVDDGSTPPADETALKAKFAFDLKVLRRDSDHGAHESRAAGARAARGARVLFLDDDIIPDATVLADHAIDDGDFSVGPIFYPKEAARTPYTRSQARHYDAYFGSLIRGPHKTRDVEFFICNASGPAREFSDFLDAVQAAMQGIPLGGEGFDESIMNVEAAKRGYRFNILTDAVVWHLDTRSLDQARRGRRRNGSIACTLALDPGREPEINRIFDIAGVVRGRHGRSKALKAKLVWKAPALMDRVADVLTFLADKGARRWFPPSLCYIPIGIAFWQGVRDVVPSWEVLSAKLSAGEP